MEKVLLGIVKNGDDHRDDDDDDKSKHGRNSISSELKFSLLSFVVIVVARILQAIKLKYKKLT